MQLIRRQDGWDPFQELAQLQADMDRYLGRSLTWNGRNSREGADWLPGVDIVEEKDRFLLRSDLPGMKQEDISIQVVDGTLTIAGERKHGLESKEGRVHRVERSYGTFLRTFTLPAGVDGNKVSATYKDGVLEVALPKRDEVQPKLVKINGN